MKKYCLFEGGDVVGPFSAQELLERAGFGSHSLVCPDEYSDEEAYWKEAHTYEEFGFSPVMEDTLLGKTETLNTEQSQQFLKEMDNVMSELSSFHVGEKEPVQTEETPSPELKKEQTPQKQEEPVQPEKTAQAEHKTSIPLAKTASSSKTGRKISALLLQASEEMKKKEEPAPQPEPKSEPKPAASQMPVLPQQTEDPKKEETQPLPSNQPEISTESVSRTISKVNPLEEYFNTMRSGDLGNILGIPDPKENSDMSLARAIHNQFEKTEPGLQPAAETEDPFDAFTPKSAPEELDESLFSEKTLVETADQETHARLMGSLPDLQQAAPLKVVGQGPSKLDEPITRPKLEISLEQDPEQDPEKTEPPTLQEVIVPEQEDDPNDRTVKTILEGTLRVDTQRREIPEPIKDVPADEAKEPAAAQAPAVSDEEEDFLQDRVVKQKEGSKWKFVFMALGAFLLLLGVLLNLVSGEEKTAEPAAAQTEQSKTEKTEKSTVSAKDVIAAMQAQKIKDPVELAKEIVQQHSLGSGRGTIEQYLQGRYQKELQNGYAALWSAEPLHKDVYVVKYRLAKTRKEPIVYIFQVNTTQKKLTGALNNITLDLVGKIR